MKYSKFIFIPVNGTIIDGTIKEDESNDKIREFLKDVITDHFWGEYEGERWLFFCDDIGLMKELPLNKRATQAYHKCCRPGTGHLIVGDVIGFRDIQV